MAKASALEISNSVIPASPSKYKINSHRYHANHDDCSDADDAKHEVDGLHGFKTESMCKHAVHHRHFDSLSAYSHSQTFVAVWLLYCGRTSLDRLAPMICAV